MDVYIDDTLASRSNQFLKLTDKISKVRIETTRVSTFVFSVIDINKKGPGYLLEQTLYQKDVDEQPNSSEFESFQTM